MNTMMMNEERKENVFSAEECLEQFTGNDMKIFIDTCSMLDDAFPLFMEHVIPLLEKHGNRIIVPLEVSRELIRHLDNPGKPELREPAVRALQLLNKYKNTYFRILGEASDTASIPDNPLPKYP